MWSWKGLKIQTGEDDNGDEIPWGSMGQGKPSP